MGESSRPSGQLLRTPNGRNCWAGNAVRQEHDGWWNADAGVCQHWRPGCSAPTDTVVRGRSDTGELSLLACSWLLLLHSLSVLAGFLCHIYSCCIYEASRIYRPMWAPRHNVPLVRFLISALYICFGCFISCASPLILFFWLLPYSSPPLLIFSFENRPAPFPGRMS